MAALEERDDAREVLADIHAYLAAYGRQGYSMDFVEPTQVEDPSALFAPLKAIVQDPDYDPRQQEERAAKVRAEKHAEIRELLTASNTGSSAIAGGSRGATTSSGRKSRSCSATTGRCCARWRQRSAGAWSRPARSASRTIRTSS